MMNDRELLELAAKAEGHTIEFDPISGLTFLDTKFSGIWWHPLHNDSDALRLAVKLGLTVHIFPTFIAVGQCLTPFSKLHIDHPYEGDAYAATRRAIVRAAAEIGKEMK